MNGIETQEQFTKELGALMRKHGACITLETKNPQAWPEMQVQQIIVEFDWEMKTDDLVLGSYFDGGE